MVTLPYKVVLLWSPQEQSSRECCVVSYTHLAAVLPSYRACYLNGAHLISVLYNDRS